MYTMRTDERQILATANEELERGTVGRQNSRMPVVVEISVGFAFSVLR